MLIGPLQLAQSVNQDTFPHQDLEVFPHCLWLSWHVDNKGLASAPDDGSAKTGCGHNFAGLLDHIED